MSVVAKQESLAVFYCNKLNRFSVKHDGVAKLQQLQLQPTLWQTRMSCIWQRGRMHAVCHKYWLSVSNDRKLLIKKCYFSNRFSPIMSVRACITVTQTNLTLQNLGPLANLKCPSVIGPCSRPCKQKILTSPMYCHCLCVWIWLCNNTKLDVIFGKVMCHRTWRLWSTCMCLFVTFLMPPSKWKITMCPKRIYFSHSKS